MRTYYFIGVLVCAAAVALRADDFTWTWEPQPESAVSNISGTSSAAVSTESTAPADSRDPGFKWSFEGEAPPAVSAAAPSSAPSGQAAPGVQTSAAGGLDAAAYQALLRDNLALRRQVEEAEGARERAESENERLRKEMRDLDSRIAASAGLIADLRKAGAAAGGDEQKAASLKARLDDAEKQKSWLEAELVSLNARLSELESSKAQPAPPTVMAGSDLFRKVEAENARLRERLVEMERRRAEDLAVVAADAAAKTNEVRLAVEAAAAVEMDQIKAELSAASEREQRDKQKIEGLLAEIPRLEDQLSTSRALRDARPAGSSGPLDLDAMQEELERREHRLRKAEKMAAMLQSARAEVREVSDREKRDMHYNMASVYMREGRFKDAEREYLQALEIDPTDAASHFNLGILYDDYMDEPRRAAVHYRRYLKLAPHAPDSDQVKSWLIKLDMR